MKLVMNVSAVHLTNYLSYPAQWSVTAHGHVNTGGWTNPKLEQRIYVAPPADGIQDFDFVAQPPGGMAPQVVLPIAAQTGPSFYPAWVKGIRVNSAANSIVESFSKPAHSIK
jgi:hypothetical protein